MNEPCERCGGRLFVNVRDLGNHAYEAEACPCIDPDDEDPGGCLTSPSN